MINSSRRGKIISVLLRIPVKVAATFTMLMFFFIVGYIVIKGVPHLKPSLFALSYNSTNVSMFPSLINTLLITLISLCISVPLGVGAAIYLVEYSKRGSKFVKVIRVTAETLSGIPSIVYGLFGLLFFVTTAKFGLSLLSGACTLSIMVLPLIMRTAEEALISVPDSYREGSFALGAGKLRTVAKVVLPPAMPGILSGIILATGRIVGETAALIYTAGTVAAIPSSLLGSGRTLSVHLYILSSEGQHLNETYATAVVLLLLVLGINTLSSYIAKKIQGGPK